MQHRILALGDSYTIGEGVAPAERWPAQLSAALGSCGVEEPELTIIAQTGWTTSELAAEIDARQPGGLFELVTLLIGVNNQYRGLPLDEYREEFRALLATAVDYAGGDAGRVIVLSIPDWSVTPFAEFRDRGQIAEQIDAFNGVNRAEAASRGARYVEITGISREAANDTGLVAPDGLHPSGRMYGRWVEALLPAAREVFSCR